MNLPLEIYSGVWHYGHCQGIAVDTQRGYIYYSFTTALVKTDLNGKLIGSVIGLLGHLGCIDYHPADNRVYGSLEYKNDAIGRGILNKAGFSGEIRDGFYIAIFDLDKIDRVDMDACNDGVMTAVYLKEVIDDYTAEVEVGGKVFKHRHGCSGIDGTTFGPMPGAKDGKEYLFVCYGIYSDLERDDNDCQVMLCYDIEGWREYEKPLSQDAMHTSGPEKPLRKFFIPTGNTNWGVQNLLYDPSTGHYLMAVYRGKKPQYPNHAMYVVDGGKEPGVAAMFGEIRETLSLVKAGESIGFDFPYGSTGMHALGDGLFYVSHDSKTEDGGFQTTVRLTKWNGKDPLETVEK